MTWKELPTIDREPVLVLDAAQIREVDRLMTPANDAIFAEFLPEHCMVAG